MTRIQAPKIFRTHNVELEASRIFPFNLVPSTRLQACAEDMEKHISDHFGLSTSFGGPRGACGQPSNGFPWRTSYEVFMVEAGAEKICVVHLGSRCQKETTDESLDRICTSCSGLNIDFLLNHPCFSSSFFVICWGFNRGK